MEGFVIYTEQAMNHEPSMTTSTVASGGVMHVAYTQVQVLVAHVERTY
jgi:hypothetical protein